MMAPERVFAKLAARVPPLVNAGGATGTPEIDASTAAALCAGMPQEQFQASLAKWACCNEALEWIRIRLHMEAMTLSQRHWKQDPVWVKHAALIGAHVGQPASVVLANLAVAEMAHPHGWTNELRASILGMGLRSYYRHTAPRYAEVCAILDRWTEDARQHVYRAQRGRAVIQGTAD